MGKLETVVYEEADKILDYGFQKELQSILEKINQQSFNFQNILVSATITNKLETLLQLLIKNKKNDDENDLEQIFAPDNSLS